MNKSIFQFNASADNIGHILIDGTIGEDWWAEDGGNTYRKVSDILAQLKAAKCTSYHVKIHSLGGDVDHALSIYSELKALPNVTTEVLGMCASAATIIFMAGTTRLMNEDALLLIHHAWSYSQGNAQQMERTVETLNTIDERLVDIYSKATGMTTDEVRELMDTNDGDGKWITADECKQKNICTEVSTGAKAETKQHFFASADLKKAALPIPAQLEELSPSTWAKIKNLIISLTSKTSTHMKKNIVAAYACLSALFSELMADEQNNVTLKAEDLQKIEDALTASNTAKAELEQKVNDLNAQIETANKEKAELEARASALFEENENLQALVDKHATADTHVDGKDNPDPDSFESFQANSEFYKQAKEELNNR